MQQKFHSFASARLMPPLHLTSGQKTSRIVRCRYEAKIPFEPSYCIHIFYFNRCIELCSIDLTRKKCGTKAFYICLSRKNKQSVNKITFDSSQISLWYDNSHFLYSWRLPEAHCCPPLCTFSRNGIVCLIE